MTRFAVGAVYYGPLFDPLYIYYMSLKNSFSWLFVDITSVQVIGLMVVWMYNESENWIFSLYFFNKDISLMRGFHVAIYHCELRDFAPENRSPS